MKVAFDVDDTLIVPGVATESGRDIPNYGAILVYKWLQLQGCEMVVWSGSGLDWAATWAEKLGLDPCEVREKKKSDDIDIAFDDCDVDLAKVNIKVKRTKNQISRKEWNETKHQKT